MKTIKTRLLIIAALFLSGSCVFLFSIYEPDIPLEQLKASYANSNSKFMEIDGLKVHYRIEGKGKPLLLIHGTGAMLQTFDVWTAILSPHYQIIRLDIPAFGLTGPRADGNYSDTMYVSFINRFLKNLRIDSCYVGGNSLGGLIAWKYAAAFPERVKKLILIDPAGFYELNQTKGSFVFNLARKHPKFTKLISKLGTQHFIKKTLNEVFFDNTKVTNERLKTYADLNRRNGNRDAFADRAQFVHQSNKNELTAITCPSLVMWGKEDRLINVGEATHFRLIPNVQFKFYEKVGHIPQEEIPEVSAKDVLDFLN
jgi:pimeloyl-ACP methyl ester carboxylesterase